MSLFIILRTLLQDIDVFPVKDSKEKQYIYLCKDRLSKKTMYLHEHKIKKQ